jgi:hypothetical protein
MSFARLLRSDSTPDTGTCPNCKHVTVNLQLNTEHKILHTDESFDAVATLFAWNVSGSNLGGSSWSCFPCIRCVDAVAVCSKRRLWPLCWMTGERHFWNGVPTVLWHGRAIYFDHSGLHLPHRRFPSRYDGKDDCYTDGRKRVQQVKTHYLNPLYPTTNRAILHLSSQIFLSFSIFFFHSSLLILFTVLPSSCPLFVSFLVYLLPTFFYTSFQYGKCMFLSNDGRFNRLYITLKF